VLGQSPRRPKRGFADAKAAAGPERIQKGFCRNA
jgi:hypothetical protein